MYAGRQAQRRRNSTCTRLLGGVLATATGLYRMHHGDVSRIVGQLLFAIGVASILFGLFAAKPLQKLRWVFENWPLQLLGCMCYSIYAWHGIVMNEMIPPATSLLSDTIRPSVPFGVLILIERSELSVHRIRTRARLEGVYSCFARRGPSCGYNRDA